MRSLFSKYEKIYVYIIYYFVTIASFIFLIFINYEIRAQIRTNNIFVNFVNGKKIKKIRYLN